MAEKILMLEPGDERAQKIAKAMGSQTASDILQLLADGPTSLTDITERLKIPMNTAKYHVENLLDAGLLTIDQTKYSVKGREVKLYALTNQLLIVAPRQSTMRSLILKYASLFGIVVFGSVIIAALTQLIGPQSMFRASMQTANAVAPEYATQYGGTGAMAKSVLDHAATNVTAAPEVMVTGARNIGETWAANVSGIVTAAPSPVPVPPAEIPLPMETVGSAFPWLDPVLTFFLGGLLVIVVLLCYEAWLWKTKK
jgi:DNA-binding transcriptional ArsR family regulator